MAEAAVIPEDDFDAMFAQAAEAAESAVASTEPAAAEPEATPAAEPAAAAEPEATPAAEPEATPAAEPAAKAEPAAPAAEPVARAEPPAPAAAPAAPPPPDPKPAPAAAPVETEEEKAQREALEASLKPYEPTPEEQAALERMKADFPNEYAAMEVRLKGMDREVNRRVHQAVTAAIQRMEKALNPVAEQVNADAVERHFAAIRSAHTDYDTVVSAIPAWIETQPAYLRPAMKAAYESGTTQDVIALVADYKKATATAAPAPAAAPAAASKPAAAPARAPSGAEDLAPVASKRVAAAPRGGGDPNDFDAAFREAAEALE